MTETPNLPAPVDEAALAAQAARERRPIPTNNGLLAPERWEMFGRIANTVANTEFVPKGLRGKAPAVMACLLYGDALGLHPSVALTEVHIVDGKPTMSATLMVGKIRMAGHRISRKEIRGENGEFLGCTAIGVRGDDNETDSFTFTMDMARRAGLLSKHNWQAYPEAMCWARCVSQLARMLYPDVFLGQSAYTAEELGVEATDDTGAALTEHPEAVERQGNAALEPVDTLTPEQQQARSDALVAQEQPAAEPETAAEPEVVEQPEPETADEQEPEDAEVVGDGSAEDDTPAPWTPLDDGPPSQEEYDEAVSFLANLTDDEKAVGGDDIELAYTLVQAFEAEQAKAAEPGPQEQAAQLPFEGYKEATIPAIVEHVIAARERGDANWIRGVMDYEVAHKNRQRLVGMLEDAIAHVEEIRRRDAAADSARQMTGEAKEPDPDPALEPEPTPEPEAPEQEPAPPAPAFAPGAGVTAPTPTLANPLAVRLSAAIGWMADHYPNEEAWATVENVLASANHVWHPNELPTKAKTLDELEDWMLEQIWTALPEPCRDAVGIEIGAGRG